MSDKKYTMNVKQYTKRIQNIIKQPKFKESLKEKEIFFNSSIPSSFESQFQFIPLNKHIFLFGILNKNTVPPQIQSIKYTSNIEGIYLALLDTIINFVQEKDIRQIQSLTLREIENYLRDDNLIASLENNATKFYPFFDLVQKELIKIIEVDTLKAREKLASPNLVDDYIHDDSFIILNKNQTYINISPEDKMIAAGKILDKYISPMLIRDGGNAYTVFADDSLIVIQYTGACSSCNLSLTSTMDYIQRVFQLETATENLMIMTDS